jgi:hypothetical protein
MRRHRILIGDIFSHESSESGESSGFWESEAPISEEELGFEETVMTREQAEMRPIEYELDQTRRALEAQSARVGFLESKLARQGRISDMWMAATNRHFLRAEELTRKVATLEHRLSLAEAEVAYERGLSHELQAKFQQVKRRKVLVTKMEAARRKYDAERKREDEGGNGGGASAWV